MLARKLPSGIPFARVQTIANEDVVMTTLSTLTLVEIPEAFASLRFTPQEARDYAAALLKAAASAEAFAEDMKEGAK